MADAHERYEELALGHVLGGLPTAAAAEFRAHLVDCRDCRSRVLELRDIAAVLAATEREERRLAAVATQQVVRRVDHDTDDAVAAPRPISRWLRLITPIAIIMLVFLAFLTFHWSRLAEVALESNRRLALVLTTVAEGEHLPMSESAPEVRGIVAQHGDVLAFDLIGMRELEAGEIVAVWEFDGDDVQDVGARRTPDDGRLAFPLEDVSPRTDRVVITIEAAEVFRDGDPDEPAGDLVAAVELTG